MNTMQRIRLYHATLAILSVLAYLSAEFDVVHAWLGYAVAVVIFLRLLWALFGDRQVGLRRFYPSFDGLRFDNAFTHPSISKSLMLGIALSLISVMLTGIVLDQQASQPVVKLAVVAVAYADDDATEAHGSGGDEILEEVHELFANLTFMFVGAHVAYMVLFRRPLAKFMLFIPKK